MYLQEIFDQLTYGELSQLSIGGGEAGVIDASNYPRVLSHINLGLTALYKRFPLKEGRVILALTAGVTEYSINKRYALQNTRSNEPVKYLLDTAAAPFADDILKIERVYTVVPDPLVDSYELALNDLSDRYSLTTPTATTLRVPADIVVQASDLPDCLKTATLELVYRANHPKIVQGLGYFEPERVLVQLPDSHLEPLLLYVASRVNTPTGMSGEFNAGNNYYAKYEASCQQLEGTNLKVDQGSQNSRLSSNGWV